MSSNNPKRHHYVPQFYLRRFACFNDINKVATIERHNDFLIADRKSINHTGYEVGLHDYVDEGRATSIEGSLNRMIETPLASSSTWRKICNGACATLNEQDKLPIYVFARHLQLRNLETLRFIETESTLMQAERNGAHLSKEELDMHRWIAATPNGARVLFYEGAIDTMLPSDANQINVMVCRSPIVLRSSTNPTLVISYPGEQSIFGSFFDSLRTWWLTLDRYWGAFIVAGGPSSFTNTTMPLDAARVINRRYLIQLQNSLSVRYLIADDKYVEEDLEWTGYRFEQRTTHGFRYRKVASER